MKIYIVVTDVVNDVIYSSKSSGGFRGFRGFIRTPVLDQIISISWTNLGKVD